MLRVLGTPWSTDPHFPRPFPLAQTLQIDEFLPLCDAVELPSTTCSRASSAELQIGNLSFLVTDEELVVAPAVAPVEGNAPLELDLSLPLRADGCAGALLPAVACECVTVLLPRLVWGCDMARDDDAARLCDELPRVPVTTLDVDLSATFFCVPILPRLLNRAVRLEAPTVELPPSHSPALPGTVPLALTWTPYGNGDGTAIDEGQCFPLLLPQAELSSSALLMPQTYDGGAALLLSHGHKTPLEPIAMPALDEGDRVVQALIPVADAVLFPGDCDCPGMSMTLPLPTDMPVAVLLAPRSVLDLDQPRVSLVALELSLCSASLAAVPVSLNWTLLSSRDDDDDDDDDDDELFPLGTVESLAGAGPRPPAPASPPSEISRVTQSEDDQFIASARAEAERLLGYADGGRGDFNHFLALCSGFTAKRSVFGLTDESEAFAAPTVLSAAAAAVGASSAVLRPGAASSRPKSSLRPLSRRKSVVEEKERPTIRPSPVLSTVHDETAALIPATDATAATLALPITVGETTAPVSIPKASKASASAKPMDLLSNYMMARGAKTKLTWSLQSFTPKDVKTSEDILEAVALAAREKNAAATVIHVLAHPLKSLLPVCLLVAAKHASSQGGRVVCVYEHLAHAQQLIEVHGGSFSGVHFRSRAKDVRSNVVVSCSDLSNDGMVDALSSSLSNKTDGAVLLICGSASFVGAQRLKLKECANVRLVVAVALPLFEPLGPCAARFVLDAPSSLTLQFDLYQSVPERVQHVIDVMETGFDEAMADVVPWLPASVVHVKRFQMVPRDGVLTPALCSLPVAADKTAMLRLLTIMSLARAALDLLGSSRLADAAHYLEVARLHPVYGPWVADTLSGLLEETRALMKESPSPLSPLARVLDERRISLVLVLSAASVSSVAAATNCRVVFAQDALLDPLFPWSDHCDGGSGVAVIWDDAGAAATFLLSSVLEVMRVRRPSSLADVRIVVSQYQAMRGRGLVVSQRQLEQEKGEDKRGDGEGVQLLDSFSSAEVLRAHSLSSIGDWKSRVLNDSDCVDGSLVPSDSVFVAPRLLASSPDLASSLSSLFGLRLVRRRQLAADIVVDERRCIFVCHLQNAPLAQVTTDLFLCSLAFSQCLLLVRYESPMHAASAQLLHQLLAACAVVCPRMHISPVLCSAQHDADLEMHAVCRFFSQSPSSSVDGLTTGVTDRESLHERILCAFPSMTPLTSQKVLRTLPLQQIFRSAEKQSMAIMSTLVPEQSIGPLMRRNAVKMDNVYINPKTGEQLTKRTASLSYSRNEGQRRGLRGDRAQTKIVWKK